MLLRRIRESRHLTPPYPPHTQTQQRTKEEKKKRKVGSAKNSATQPPTANIGLTSVRLKALIPITSVCVIYIPTLPYPHPPTTLGILSHRSLMTKC